MLSSERISAHQLHRTLVVTYKLAWFSRTAFAKVSPLGTMPAASLVSVVARELGTRREGLQTAMEMLVVRAVTAWRIAIIASDQPHGSFPGFRGFVAVG